MFYPESTTTVPCALTKLCVKQCNDCAWKHSKNPYLRNEKAVLDSIKLNMTREFSETDAFWDMSNGDDVIEFRFRTCAILHCLNQIRIFYKFPVKTNFHHNICHNLIHRNFLKNLSKRSVDCNTCKNDRRPQIRTKMNCEG